MSSAESANGSSAVAVAEPGAALRSDRGTTTIAPTVIERIAQRAATEIDGVETAQPSTIRRLVPFLSDTTADAAVGHERAAVELAITVRYPAPVWRTADEVRDHVITRVEDLSGLKMTRVNIVVGGLAMEQGRRRRVV